MQFTTKSLAASAAMFMVLAGCGGGPPAAPLHGAMLSPQAKLEGQCDFTVSVAPASATITSGQSAYFRVNLQSLGLQGTINVLISDVSPKTKYEPSFYEPAYDIHLPLNGSGFAQIIASATDKTVKTTYTVTVKAQDITSGCGYGVTHYATFMLTVT